MLEKHSLQAWHQTAEPGSPAAPKREQPAKATEDLECCSSGMTPRAELYQLHPAKLHSVPQFLPLIPNMA